MLIFHLVDVKNDPTLRLNSNEIVNSRYHKYGRCSLCKRGWMRIKSIESKIDLVVSSERFVQVITEANGSHPLFHGTSAALLRIIILLIV